MQELIVGVTERLSFGSGKEVMPYLKEEEMSLSWSLGLTEAGNMGHIVPDHEVVLTKVFNRTTFDACQTTYMQSHVQNINYLWLFSLAYTGS